MSVLRLSGISKEFAGPRGAVPVLAGIDLEILPSQAVAISGPSGSGKSTLLAIIGVLEPPDRGQLTLGGVNPFQFDTQGQAKFRNQNIGFVFQDHSLLPQATLLENVLMPAFARPEGPADFETRAKELIGAVGLAERSSHKPSQLSGGERQRAAIARALLLSPPVLLCDEPTGNLDSESAGGVADLLLELHGQLRNILIVVTHSRELAARLPVRYEVDRATRGLRRLAS